MGNWKKVSLKDIVLVKLGEWGKLLRVWRNQGQEGKCSYAWLHVQKVECIYVLLNTCIKFDEDWGGPCTNKYIKIVILNFKPVND